jgi:hypothetical protein
MNDEKAKIIIEGVTDSGEIFRPSNWAECVGDKLSTYHHHRVQYSPLLQPGVKDGHACVLLDPELKKTNPTLYQSILDFAKINKLKICNNDNSIEEEH